MQRFIITLLTSIFLLVNIESIYAKSNSSLANDPDLIVFLLNRLEQLADQAEPLYKKAQNGKANDRKQLLYLYGEVQIIGELFDMFDGFLTVGQKEKESKGPLPQDN